MIVGKNNQNENRVKSTWKNIRITDSIFFSPTSTVLITSTWQIILKPCWNLLYQHGFICPAGSYRAWEKHIEADSHLGVMLAPGFWGHEPRSSSRRRSFGKPDAQFSAGKSAFFLPSNSGVDGFDMKQSLFPRKKWVTELRDTRSWSWGRSFRLIASNTRDTCCKEQSREHIFWALKNL